MAKANKLSVKHFSVMSALTMATGGGRLNAFMEDANEETRDAILKVAKRNLDLLIEGKSLPKKGKKDKAEKTERSTKKTSKKVREVTAKSNKVVKAKAKAAKTEKAPKGERGNIAMSSQKVAKLVGTVNDAVLRLKDKYSDDLTALRGAVKRKVGGVSGIEVRKVNRNGSAVVEYKGNVFKTLFKANGPTVKFIKMA